MHCDDAAAQGFAPGKAHLHQVFRATVLAFSAALTYTVLVGILSGEGAPHLAAQAQFTGNFALAASVSVSPAGITLTREARARTLPSDSPKIKGRRRGDTHLASHIAVAVPMGLS
jgi:hypothetical protein